MSSYAPYTYDNTEGGTEFTVPFPYVDESHLLVYVADELKQLKADYWINRDTNKIVFRSPVPAGDAVRIERETKKSIVFKDGSNIRPDQISGAIEEKSLLLLEQRLNVTGGVVTASGNLSDLTNYAEARDNLDVYSTTQINTLKDSYLKDSNNLSDLTNIVTARTNLDIYSKGEVVDSIRDKYIVKGERIITNQPNSNYRLMQCKQTDYGVVANLGDYVSIGDEARIISYASIPIGVSSTNKYLCLEKDGTYGCKASYRTTYPDSVLEGYRGLNILGWGTGDDFVPYTGFYGSVGDVNTNMTFDIINGFTYTHPTPRVSYYLRLPRGTQVTINYSITMNVTGNSSYPYVYIIDEETGAQSYGFKTYSNLSPKESSYSITSTTSDLESVTYNLYEDDWTGSTITKTGSIGFVSTSDLESGGTITLSGNVVPESSKSVSITWWAGEGIGFLTDTFNSGRTVYSTSIVPSMEVICTKS